MNPTIIRPAQIKDVPFIRQIYNYAVLHLNVTMDTKEKSPEDMLHWFKQHGGRFPIYVGEVQGCVMGVGYLSPWSLRQGYALMSEVSVYLNPIYLNQGLGGRLLDYLIEAGKNQGFITLIGVMTRGNERASAILTKRHFEWAGRLHKAGLKFGKLLDIDFYQLALDVPSC